MTCYRYIDLNPVRAGIVAKAQDYEWSSHGQHVAVCGRNWLSLSDAFLALGTDVATRSVAYGELVSEGIDKTALSAIRTAIKGNQFTGMTQFQEMISKRIGRRVSAMAPGRPPISK